MTPRQKADLDNWIYDYSKPLDMEYAWRKTSEGIEIMTNDRIHYSPDEIRIISQTTGEITPEIHMAKRIFKGVVVEK